MKTELLGDTGEAQGLDEIIGTCSRVGTERLFVQETPSNKFRCWVLGEPRDWSIMGALRRLADALALGDWMYIQEGIR